MRLLAKLGRVSLLVPLALQGCGERDHVRISEKEVPGTYVASFETGKEQLILRSDKSYEQIFSSPTKKFRNRGKWEAKYVLLEGTDIGLIHANCSEDRPPAGPDCYRNLNVHREGGKLKLALNEAADFITSAKTDYRAGYKRPAGLQLPREITLVTALALDTMKQH